MWLFTGEKYAIYSNMHEDISAPETFEDISELNMTWTRDLSAALYVREEDIVYFFKEFSYYRYDLAARNQLDLIPILIDENAEYDESDLGRSSLSLFRARSIKHCLHPTQRCFRRMRSSRRSF